jgi:hypothetical protein
MDRAAPEHPSSRFFGEVRQWLDALTKPTGTTLTEPNPGYFLLQNQQRGTLLLRLQPLLANVPAVEPLAYPLPAGTRTITLWEDVWRSRKDIVQSRISALLGQSQRIPGRVTGVQKIDRPTTQRFLEENHLQAPVLSKYKYGLFLPHRYFRVLAPPPALPNNESSESELLVAVATFAHPRTFRRGELPHRSYELVRFANLKNTTVVGGLDKLLQQFIREHQPNDIMTYVDLEWSTGTGYQKLGFAPEGDTSPLSFWVDTHSYERYYPHRLPEGVTEENASESGLIKIRNAGSRKFVKTL